MFLNHQGYDLEKNVIFQDNQSAIKMEKNGRNSCTGNSRHIDIRYFFIKDRVENKEILIEFCLTENMLADNFTKPLQGRLFNFFRNIIMGYQDISTLSELKNSKFEERDGNNISSQANSENVSKHVQKTKSVSFDKNVSVRTYDKNSSSIRE